MPHVGHEPPLFVPFVCWKTQRPHKSTRTPHRRQRKGPRISRHVVFFYIVNIVVLKCHEKWRWLWMIVWIMTYDLLRLCANMHHHILVNGHVRRVCHPVPDQVVWYFTQCMLPPWLCRANAGPRVQKLQVAPCSQIRASIVAQVSSYEDSRGDQGLCITTSMNYTSCQMAPHSLCRKRPPHPTTTV